MPKLTIDGLEIDVPPGTKVIDAAERLGIMIPRFCFHPALGSVGACRVCAVNVLEGVPAGIQMSCMLDAADGMVVSTTDAAAVAFRQRVIEWLMINHPHDCPVCDEGGHCLLQDTTVAGGHGLRRFQGKKRTYRDQYLGPLVQHELNRCIQCYRCTRYYREFAGYPDLGVMGIGSRVYFGRRAEGTLESPFAGNLIDICPTGVYTDKPSRFKGRRWDFERKASLCIHCGLGCHTVVSARYREVVRQEARFSAAVNGHFICDRGRYGFYYTEDAGRPRSARVDGRACAVGAALETAAQRLGEIAGRFGDTAVAAAGAGRSSLETLAALHHLCRARGWRAPAFFSDPAAAGTIKRAVDRLSPGLAVSLQELAAADFILAVAADPVNEAPMLALAMRQAWRAGAGIAVIDPRPVDLPMSFAHVPMAPEAVTGALGALLKAAVSREAAAALGPEAEAFYDALPGAGLSDKDPLADIARTLSRSRHPVIVCGTDAGSEPLVDLAADAAVMLRSIAGRAGLFFLMPGANDFGAALIADDSCDLERLLAAMEAGQVRALILVENDPFWYYPDRGRLERALNRLDLLVVADCLDTPAAGAAHVFVPTTTLYESGGLFINQEGRMQQAQPAFGGGRSIAQDGDGGHPPRTFRPDIPGGEPAAAWQSLAALTAHLCGEAHDEPPGNPHQWLADAHPVFAGRDMAEPLAGDGVRMVLPAAADRWRRHADPPGVDPPDRTFTLLTVDRTFGTEELCRLSPCLQEREDRPVLWMHREDAAAAGLSDGQWAVVATDAGSVRVPVGVAANMAPGVLVLPRHRRIPWQVLGRGPVRLRKDGD